MLVDAMIPFGRMKRLLLPILTLTAITCVCYNITWNKTTSNRNNSKKTELHHEDRKLVRTTDGAQATQSLSVKRPTTYVTTKIRPSANIKKLINNATTESSTSTTPTSTKKVTTESFTSTTPKGTSVSQSPNTTKSASRTSKDSLTVLTKSSTSTSRFTTSSTTALQLSANLTLKKMLMPARMDGYLHNNYLEGCDISRCTFVFSDNIEDVYKVDVAVIEFDSKLVEAVAAAKVRRKAPVLVYAHESPGYKIFQWKQAINTFDGTMTYARNATVNFPMGAYKPLAPENVRNTTIDYAKGKSRGAYAYVSNCDSAQYNRLQTMKELSNYVDVEILGQCTKKVPCPRADTDCEEKVHSQYRFYLAFENSLCEDYISEKFWKAIFSHSHLVPVALGGLSIENYNRIAPPDSFIHAYNFTSIEELGKYLRHLMEDDAAYNRYHQWKQQYTLDLGRHQTSCDLCKLAHNPNSVESTKHRKFADEWNDPSNCRRLNQSATQIPHSH